MLGLSLLGLYMLEPFTLCLQFKHLLTRNKSSFFPLLVLEEFN